MQFLKNFLNLIVVAWNNNNNNKYTRRALIVYLHTYYIVYYTPLSRPLPPSPPPPQLLLLQWRRRRTSTLCAHGFCECRARFIEMVWDIPQVPTTVHRFVSFFSHSFIHSGRFIILCWCCCTAARCSSSRYSLFFCRYLFLFMCGDAVRLVCLCELADWLFASIFEYSFQLDTNRSSTHSTVTFEI